MSDDRICRESDLVERAPGHPEVTVPEAEDLSGGGESNRIKKLQNRQKNKKSSRRESSGSLVSSVIPDGLPAGKKV